MKSSKYNFFFKYSDDSNIVVCYNARTNALAKINQNLYDRYLQYMKGNTKALEDKEIKDLIYGGFIIDRNVNELEILKERMYLDRYGNNHGNLAVTIAPTLKCNFACPYCYEQGDKPDKMTIELQDRILELLESQKDLLKSFSVTWYGGEPLLAFDVIENLSNKFIDICRKNNIEYTASMVTNGYLLNREICKKLVSDLKVNVIQITIDGMAETHDKTRILHNKNGTFEQIIENLKDSIDLLEGIVTIRTNVNKENYLDAHRLNDFLQKEKLLGKINHYFANVRPVEDNYSDNLCFSEEEFDSINELYNKTCRIEPQYPQLKSTFCTADNMFSMVISSDGDIYKCWHDVGVKEKRIGNILVNNNYFDEMKYLRNKYRYTMYDPTIDEECKDCNILPICMGGCPEERLNANERCISFKYNLKDKLLRFLQYMEETSV